jgi:hypothetical protein
VQEPPLGFFEGLRKKMVYFVRKMISSSPLSDSYAETLDRKAVASNCSNSGPVYMVVFVNGLHGETKNWRLLSPIVQRTFDLHANLVPVRVLLLHFYIK